ncbi:hypothetical protein DPMN_186411 [Dreissena polymorpha]|uniref:Uncharacterized protein n=1 Tax=Dreissena polymorpha TaxID=45954 RepID=A0A9D4DP28_DREPO|nr:hypothetical protein DPMN_186411 [Dreissena polymorpha]
MVLLTKPTLANAIPAGMVQNVIKISASMAIIIRTLSIASATRAGMAPFEMNRLVSTANSTTTNASVTTIGSDLIARLACHERVKTGGRELNAPRLCVCSPYVLHCVHTGLTDLCTYAKGIVGSTSLMSEM